MEQQYIQKSRLFRESYLPGGVVKLRNDSYAMVVGTRNNPQALQNVDETQLFDVINRFLLEWQDLIGGEVDEMLKYALSSRTLLVHCPSDVYISPYPLLLQCAKCKILDFYQTGISEEKLLSEIKKRSRKSGGRSLIQCKNPACNGHMVQLPYLSVHRCGSLSPINLPFQALRVKNITFADQGGSFFGSAFGNYDTGEKIATALSMPCSPCTHRHPEGIDLSQRGTPITSGESFFPHAVQYISLNKDTGRLISDICAQIQSNSSINGLGIDLAEGIVAGLLGVIPQDSLREMFTKMLYNGSADNTSVEEIEEKIRLKQQAYNAYYDLAKTDPLMQEILASVEKDLADLHQKLKTAKGVFKEIRTYIENDELINAIANERRTQESVFFRGAFKEFTIKDRLLDEKNPETKEIVTQNWDDLKSKYGVADVVHISNLNVVLSTIGYTREKRYPYSESESVTPVILKAFEDRTDQNLRGKAIVYAMSAETEGLLIRLDPRKILKWCHEEFNWPLPSDSLLTDRIAAHAHLLKTCPALICSPTEVYRETKFLDIKQSAPFHLLHTISHCLLSTAKRHSGYDEKSLTEYLLPMDLSFLIYVTSVQNYTAGGLLTLFKHYLLPWFDDASNFAFHCVFDPICSDQGSSCSGCVQTVLGCETFNFGLSRSYLFGGEVKNEDRSLNIIKGYWNGK